MRKPLFLFFFWILVGAGVLAGEQKAGAEGMVEQVLQLSGIPRQLEQIPAQIQAQLPQYKAKTSPREYSVLSKVMTESFRAEAVYQPVKAYFVRNYNEAHALAFVQAYQTPLFRKLIDLEIQASSPQGMQGMQSYMAQMQSSPPSQARVQLVERLLAAMDAMGIMKKMMKGMVMGGMKAMEPLVPPKKRVSQAEMEKQLDGMYGDANPQMRQLKYAVTVSSLYTYRSVPDSDLQAYIRFWESDAGKWFSRNLGEGISIAMGQVGQDAANRIKETLQAGKKKAQ